MDRGDILAVLRASYVAVTAQMLAGVCDAPTIVPKTSSTDPQYPGFEVSAYVLFLSDYMASTHLRPEARSALFNCLADAALEALNMEKGMFDRVLNMRMREYAERVAADNSQGGVRTQARWDKLLENLAYACDENELFEWDVDVKPLAPVSMMTKMMLLWVHREVLMPAEGRFLIMWGEILRLSPDLSDVSRDLWEEAQSRWTKGIREAAAQLPREGDGVRGERVSYRPRRMFVVILGVVLALAVALPILARVSS